MKIYEKVLLIIVFVIMLLPTKSIAGDTTTVEIREAKRLIAKYDIKHPEIVLRQVCQETGWLKCDSSRCALRYNNVFGMRSSMWATQENPKGYKTYDNMEQSVADYKKWQTKHYKKGNYYSFLNRIGYAVDPEYTNKLKSLKF